MRVMRQVHFSTADQRSVDLVLFVNGLPVATLELKTDFTQSVADAIDAVQDHPAAEGPGHGQGRSRCSASAPARWCTSRSPTTRSG